jgi:hypothetical protein
MDTCVYDNVCFTTSRDIVFVSGESKTGTRAPSWTLENPRMKLAARISPDSCSKPWF